MNVQAEKIELIKQLLNTSDESILKQIKAIFKKEESDFWDELDAKVKADVEEAIKQADRGELIPHEQVMKKYKKWL